MKTTIKSTLIAALILFFYQNIEAQSRFGAAVVAGGNITQMTNDGSGGFNKLGLHVGIKGIIHLQDKHDIGIGIQYDQRGARNSSAEFNISLPFKISLNYITVPVTYSFKDWYKEDENYYKIHFTGGLAYGRLFQRSQNTDNFSILIDEECFDNYANGDLSWLLGASYFINKNWSFTAFHLRSIFSVKAEKEGGVCPFLLPYQWTFRLEYNF